jgi:hypothetical protein
MTSRRHARSGAIAIAPTPGTRLREELTYLRGQIAAHRAGPPARPRVAAALTGAALGVLAAYSLSIPSCFGPTLRPHASSPAHELGGRH